MAATKNENAPIVKRRLLHKFNKRRQLHQQQGNSNNNVAAAGMMPDVGILGSPRFLQDETTTTTAEDEIQFYCPRTTCPAALCDCAESGGSLERCSNELQSVCLNGQLDDCVFHEYVEVYKTVYCGFTFCLNDGDFQDNQCDCAFYDMYCDQIQADKETCNLINADSGGDGGNEKMPFFGCDETELATICDQAKSCKDNGDLKGVPVEEWKGMAFRMNGAGGRSSSSSSVLVMASLGLLSTFVFMWNN
jgi:hypothetical protein